ncbi:chemotaxis response regulator protein-glutamate methylesterase [Psychrosphaera aquimarina]|uniref:Protein-glutamate methylesterase/protein-glutamine glutaminase n=1 Tax=Psychrosphaera aquimarina TaxID=2044854 RepID=A0ABU3QZ68_9GAMM|nr:chemotaxis response regulator protein-glutamate methylesterase [Psychrosphaera aquimarina]MDU0112512.1 chemotaxis response regulator protein-glutamate methylesterase [Psychrosphaera aquimarina]
MNKIRVLIIDDSAVIRKVVRELLTSDPEIIVVGEAENPLVARELIKTLSPDILTLDIEMPKMDGITFLANLMRLRPMPVVMLSTLTTKGSDITLQALELGAIDFITKPSVGTLLATKSQFKDILIDKVKHAVNVDQKQHFLNSKLIENSDTSILPFSGSQRRNHIIAIGASTGGTEALKVVLSRMPKNSPPVVVAQHIPPTFSERFANRLNEICEMTVQEARHGAKIKEGNVYIAQGAIHLKIEEKNGALFCVFDDSDKVNRHKPSVDVLFQSLLPMAGNVQAVLLTGMGNDGAQGMLELKQQGARTVIQDENSSLIWGMPGSAYKLSAHQEQCDLFKISENLLIYAALTRGEMNTNEI